MWHYTSEYIATNISFKNNICIHSDYKGIFCSVQTSHNVGMSIVSTLKFQYYSPNTTAYHFKLFQMEIIHFNVSVFISLLTQISYFSNTVPNKTIYCDTAAQPVCVHVMSYFGESPWWCLHLSWSSLTYVGLSDHTCSALMVHWDESSAAKNMYLNAPV